jgi:murein DD-endopeptidase MepM/ murein hydrolase activator NlpD
MNRAFCRTALIFFLCSAFLVVFVDAAAAADKEHIVQSGETVYSLARRYGVKPEEILFLNSIEDARKIMAGQKLRIPGGQIQAPPVSEAVSPRTALIDYKVVHGDTLYGIARKFGISYQTLANANKFSKNKVLITGEVIKVPQAAGSTGAVAMRSNLPEQKKPTAPPLPGIPPEKMIQPVRPGSASPWQSPPPSLNKPTERMVDRALIWPVRIKEAAYMTGKLDGVILTGDKSTLVKSISSGTVASAGPYRGFGRVAIVQSDAGYIYVYGGCESLSVHAGEHVKPGTELGRLGIDAVSQKPQLFFMVYNGAKAIDPAKAPRS